MIIDRAMLKVADAASKEDTRFSLKTVQLSKTDGATATNGHILARVAPTEMADEDFPLSETISRDTADFAPFLIPADAAREIAKALPKPSRVNIPIVQCARLAEVPTNENGHATIIVTDLETERVFHPRKVEGSFPDIQKALPKEGEEPVFRIALNADYLWTLADIAATAAESRDRLVELAFYGSDRVIVVKAQGFRGERFLGAMMPIGMRK